MSTYLRRIAPIGIIWIIFVVFSIFFFTGALEVERNTISLWGTIVGAFTGIVAAVIYVIRAADRIPELVKNKKLEGVYLEILPIFIFFVFVVVYFALGLDSDQWSWIESWVYVPGMAVSYGFAPLYLPAGVYRSWRIRSVESAILVISFVLVCFRTMPILGAFATWIQVPGNWIAEVLGRGSFRVLRIGAGIGEITLIVRALRGHVAGYD